MPVVLDLYVRGVPRPRPSADAMPIRGGRGAMVYYKYEEYYPHAKGTPRVRKPWDAARWRDAIKAAAERAWSIYTPCDRNVAKGNGKLKDPLEGPIFAAVDFFFPRHQELLDNPFKYGKEPFKYAKRPDADNLWKLAADAITDVGVWVDDSRVDVQIQRWYCAIGGAPGMRLVLEVDSTIETLFSPASEAGV